MSITNNKKAFHDYYIEEKYEAGLVLEGWEVKAIRAGRVQIKEAYVRLVRDAFYLIGSNITPLISASTHVYPEPMRDRKLLLNKREIEKLSARVDRAGYTLLPLDMHFVRGRIKLEIGLGKGKKQHDKRDVEREKDAKREVARVMKSQNKF